MRILIDTDVILDLALNRDPHAENAARLFEAIQAGAVSASVAWHTISNIYYLLAGGRQRSRAVEFVRDLALLTDVAPANNDTLKLALSLPMRDFEDAMQAACAVAAGVDTIVTRNVRDFSESPVPAVSPADIQLPQE